ncbi:MAG: potassium channel family protein [Akkermansia sp.]
MKFVIIGCGQFGRALALCLTDLGAEVTVLDEREAPIAAIKDRVAFSRVGDATDIRVLRKLSLVGGDITVIVAVGEQYERNLIISAQLRELGVKNLLSRSVNDLHTRILQHIGVKDIFRVEDVAARQLAAHFTSEGLIRLRRMDNTHSLADVDLPAEWVNRKLNEVGLRDNFNLNLLTVRRGDVHGKQTDDDVFATPEQPVIDTPKPDLVFQEGDVLVLFGRDTDLQRFVARYKRS